MGNFFVPQPKYVEERDDRLIVFASDEALAFRRESQGAGDQSGGILGKRSAQDAHIVETVSYREEDGDNISSIGEVTSFSSSSTLHSRKRRQSQDQLTELAFVSHHTKALDRQPMDFEFFEVILSDAERKVGIVKDRPEDFWSLANKDLHAAARTSGSEPYGQLLPAGAERLMKDVLQLKSNECFIDYGSGLGHVVIQAAYTYGCEARGIENNAERCEMASRLRDEVFSEMKKWVSGMQDGPVIKFKMGCMQSKENRQFLSCPNDKVVKGFVNNFNGIFADRNKHKKHQNCRFLDHSLAGIFALMPPGSVLVTLQDLCMTVPSCSRVNELRERNGLLASPYASFYEHETINLNVQANESLSWCHHSREVIVYKYTRLKQQLKPNEAAFLCANRKCKAACEMTFMLATEEVQECVGAQEAERLVLKSACPVCACPFRAQRK